MQRLSLPLIFQVLAIQVQQNRNKEHSYQRNGSLFTSMPHTFLPTSVTLKTGVIKSVRREKAKRAPDHREKLLLSPSGAHCDPEEGILKRFLQIQTFPKNIPQNLIYSFDKWSPDIFSLPFFSFCFSCSPHKPFLTFYLVTLWASLMKRKQGFLRSPAITTEKKMETSFFSIYSGNIDLKRFLFSTVFAEQQGANTSWRESQFSILKWSPMF